MDEQFAGYSLREEIEKIGESISFLYGRVREIQRELISVKLEIREVREHIEAENETRK